MKNTARRIYHWVHHTGRYDGNTCVQRVLRALGAALAKLPDAEFVPVRWCSERRQLFAPRQPGEKALPDMAAPSWRGQPKRTSPLHLTLAGAAHPRDEWVIIPEVIHLGNAVGVPGVAL